MDPATTFCPHLACAARGQTGQGNIGIHSCKDKRLLCTACQDVVAYPGAADNVSRSLPIRLKGVNQPIIRT